MRQTAGAVPGLDAPSGARAAANSGWQRVLTATQESFAGVPRGEITPQKTRGAKIGGRQLHTTEGLRVAQGLTWPKNLLFFSPEAKKRDAFVVLLDYQKMSGRKRLFFFYAHTTLVTGNNPHS